jgi:arylsulfatase
MNNCYWFLCLLILLAGCQLVAQPQTPAAKRPNILLIMADDMGFSDLGCYGGDIPTPNLDRLAAGGLRFRQFYNAARCCPTRASLLTGQYPHQAGMGHMVVNSPDEREPGPYQGYLNQTCATLAEVLAPAGYRCYLSGKWHVGEFRPVWPIDRGFDRAYGLISGAMNYWNIHEGKRPDIERIFVEDSTQVDPSQAPGFYATTAFTQQASRYLGTHFDAYPEDPFFLYLAYNAPHWPMHAPEARIQQHLDRYRGGWDSLRQVRYQRIRQLGLWPSQDSLGPPDAESTPWQALLPAQRDTMTRLMATYAAMVEIMDEGIGQLITQLEEAGELEHTLILFLSDNGACAESGPLGRNYRPDLTGPLGGPDSYRSYGLAWANASNTPLRKFKSWTHEGGMSTPLIAHWPAGIQARGAWTDALGHVMDVMPTFAAVAGAAYPDSLHGQALLPLPGKSLLPVLTGESPQVRSNQSTICWEHSGNRAVRRGPWKLVAAQGETAWHLYDLRVDRGEMTDLAGEQPALTQELAAIYAQWAMEMGVIDLGE